LTPFLILKEAIDIELYCWGCWLAMIHLSAIEMHEKLSWRCCYKPVLAINKQLFSSWVLFLECNSYLHEVVVWWSKGVLLMAVAILGPA
jgi:hypothetical protein